jgi:hypothetical protein
MRPMRWSRPCQALGKGIAPEFRYGLSERDGILPARIMAPRRNRESWLWAAFGEGPRSAEESLECL